MVKETPVTVKIDDNTITLFWGEKPTGGYHIRIEDMQFLRGTLTVFYALKSPKPGDMVIMVITYPSATADLPVKAETIEHVKLVEIDS